MSVIENIQTIKTSLPDQVQLVAVSKTKPAELLLEAYSCGQRAFGENKVQELVQKFEELPKDIEWHYIGHLQTNKIKYIAPFVHLIHGVDSLKLLSAINKEGRKLDRKVACLLQFHIAEEETKFGLSLREAVDLLTSEEFGQMQHVVISGVMGMATYTEDEQQIRKEFANLKSIFETVKLNYFEGKPDFKELSMGMSGDFRIAIEEGSTMVRIGSTIFGERNY